MRIVNMCFELYILYAMSILLFYRMLFLFSLVPVSLYVLAHLFKIF